MPPKKKEETVASSAPSDDTDVQPAIDSETQDGKGDDPVPESDFSSYATAGVEQELAPLPVVVSQVLNGEWGNYEVLRDRLEAAGYNSTSVLTLVNDRLVRGAPSAYRPNALQLADQVARGEWGGEKGLRQRIEKAGFTYIDVLTQIRRRPQ